MFMVQGASTLLIPMLALFSEKVGYQKVLNYSTLLIPIAAFILFKGGELQSKEIAIVGLCLYTLANSGIAATVFRYMFDCLPVEVRCTGSSFSYSICMAVLGGTAPIIADKFIQNGYITAPAYYIMAFALLSYLSYSLNVNHRGNLKIH